MNKDSLYRVSFKCLIINDQSKVLVVKERGRNSWDLPGGGIEYDETIEESIQRELFEEVLFTGSFTYKIFDIHDPVKLLTRDIRQIHIVLLLHVDNYNFGIGEEADEIKFVNPDEFKSSIHESELRIINYMKHIEK